jgi:hypothetical protein
VAARAERRIVVLVRTAEPTMQNAITAGASRQTGRPALRGDPGRSLAWISAHMGLRAYVPCRIQHCATYAEGHVRNSQEHDATQDHFIPRGSAVVGNVLTATSLPRRISHPPDSDPVSCSSRQGERQGGAMAAAMSAVLSFARRIMHGARWKWNPGR